MFNALQFLSDFSIQYEIQRHGWINISCPFPGCADSGFHGGINLEKGFYNCWKCGYHSLEKTVQALLLIPYFEAKEIIQSYTLEIQLKQQLSGKDKKSKNIVQSVELPGEPLQKPHKKYLESRGFDWKEIQEKYKILGTLQFPNEYKFRIIIPIFHNGKLVSFQTRDYTNQQKFRYKNCPIDKSIIHYKHILYGLDNLNHNQIALVEGVFDQWKMGSGFACSFGTALTNQQIKLLSKFERVFILFDSEPYTQKKAMKYAQQLAAGKTQVEVIDLELGERDPGELEEKEIRYIRKELNFI